MDVLLMWLWGAMARMLDVLKPRGRYDAIGALPGRLSNWICVSLSQGPDAVWMHFTRCASFPNLVGYLDSGEIKPLVARQ